MRLLVGVVRSHRILLVLSTVGLGVAGSKVADDYRDPAWVWLLCACALLLWLSDVCRQVDDMSRELVKSAKVTYAKAATDFLRGSDAAKVGLGSAIFFAFTIVAVVWPLLSLPRFP